MAGGIRNHDTCFFIAFSNPASPTAPTIESITFPLLNITNVGMENIPRPEGALGFSSTFILAKVILPAYLPASLSNIGCITRHGPHHSAQKSTIVGVELAMTR